jgi:hypothetical protein
MSIFSKTVRSQCQKSVIQEKVPVKPLLGFLTEQQRRLLSVWVHKGAIGSTPGLAHRHQALEGLCPVMAP